jgi:hypothetical protein
VTPDLNRLRASLDALREPFEEIEFEYVDDPDWGEPSDTSYLTAADRSNPDIMDNVGAMAATNQLISWFGRDCVGFVGLWRHQPDLPIERAPVVRLDTEGQYFLVATTVPDYLAISGKEASFARIRDALTAVGFTVSSSRQAIWHAVDLIEGKRPDAYHSELYNQARARRGLKPI